jgi:tetratricopeptide (TPR) repeat protein
VNALSTTSAGLPPSLEEDVALAALRRSIVRANGFTLLLAVCNSPARRDRLIARLSESLSRPLQVVPVDWETVDVLPLAEKAAEANGGSPLALVGFEKGIRNNDFAHPRIAVLNHRREEWRERVRVPVVFWVPEYLLRPLSRGAPDFLDWRAGTFFFVDEAPPPQEVRRHRGGPEVWRLTAEERRDRIDELRTLIHRFSAPPHHEDHAVNRWRLELARHLTVVGETEEARRLIQDELLPACRESDDDRLAAQAWDALADVLYLRGDFDETLRIRREEQLPVYERLGDVRSRAVALGKIADVLQARGELDEALRIRREEEVPVYERLGDLRERALALGKIADVLQARGELDEALRIRREEVLPVYDRLGDVRSRALALGKIADVLQARGELDEALRIRREEVLPVFERLGDLRERAVTVGKIAGVLQARGELDEALRVRTEEELPVFERLGDVRSRAVTLGKIADVLQARGELDEALRIRREEELPVFERLGALRERAVTLGKIADVLGARGELEEALRILREEVLPIFERLGALRDLLVGRTKLALTLLTRDAPGDREEARELLRLAFETARRLSIPETDQIRAFQQRYGLEPSTEDGTP